jgi:hypothetical protein
MDYSESKTFSSPGMKLTELKSTSVGIHVVIELTVAIALTLISGCGVPSDSKLRDKFSRERSSLVELVQMSNEDEHVSLIMPNFTYLDTDTSWPRKDIGFSKERWNEYRRMFRKLGINGGLVRRTDYYPSTVFIVAYASGGVLGSSYKGYVYSPQPLSPVVSSLDAFPQERYLKAKGHAIEFEKLEDGWYLYREEY